MELAGSAAGGPPLANPLTGGGVFEDAGVTVAVGDKEMAVRPEGDVGGADEATLTPGGLLAHFDLHQLFALRSEFQDGGAFGVGGPDVAGGVDADAVRNFVETASPASQDMSGGIDDDDGVGFIATLKKINIALAIDVDPGNHAEFPAGGRSLNGELSAMEDRLRRGVEQSPQMRGGLRLGGVSWGLGDKTHRKQQEDGRFHGSGSKGHSTRWAVI